MSDVGAKPLESIPCDLGRLHADWYLRLTAFRVREVKPPDEAPLVEMTFTFAFGGNVKDVDAVRRAFRPFTATRQSDFQSRGKYVAFYLFDEESVVLAKPDVSRIEGAEVTGLDGDAFRAVVHCAPDCYALARKVEPRVVE